VKNKENTLKNVLFILNIIIFYYLLYTGRNQYLYGMNYFRCILFMLLNSLSIFFYGILKNDKKSYSQNIIYYIVLYGYLLFTITFIISRTEFRFYNWWYSGQYIPFNTIISQFKYGSTLSFAKNVVGNLVMLIPLSFLLMIKNKKYNNILKQSIIILSIIIIIELLQASTHTGAFDIDDIILNYFGTLIFTFIITRFYLIDKIRNLFYTDFNLTNKLKTILFYVSLIMVAIYDIFIFIK